MSDALTRVVVALVENRRSFAINWTERASEYDDRPSPFPIISAQVADQRWQLFFDGNKTGGWSFRSACTSTKEQRGLARLITAIETNEWPTHARIGGYRDVGI